MRFIGCKKNILGEINSFLEDKGVSQGTLYDVFSGTTSVASFFKTKGFRVISNDLLYFSYVLQRAYIQNNGPVTYAKLLKTKEISRLSGDNGLAVVISYLNSLPGVAGFVYQNYTIEGTKKTGNIRMYFQADNGKKIDAVRLKIEEWKKREVLTESEYYVLLAALIEAVPSVSNISGTYGAFLKFWDSRTYNPLTLIPPALIVNKQATANLAFNEDGVKQFSKIKCDIAYIDPPYNNRQYAPNYHILETVARYDNPLIHGVTGVRGYQDLKSQFCSRKSAKQALSEMVRYGKYGRMLLSYNTEGIMTEEDILEAMSVTGCRVEKKEITYRRFKSHNHSVAVAPKISELFYYIEQPTRN